MHTNVLTWIAGMIGLCKQSVQVVYTKTRFSHSFLPLNTRTELVGVFRHVLKSDFKPHDEVPLLYQLVIVASHRFRGDLILYLLLTETNMSGFPLS